MWMFCEKDILTVLYGIVKMLEKHTAASHDHVLAGEGGFFKVLIIS